MCFNVAVDFVRISQSPMDEQKDAVISCSALCSNSVYLVNGFSVQSSRVGKNQFCMVIIWYLLDATRTQLCKTV